MNVDICVSINGYLFKYIYLVCYLNFVFITLPILQVRFEFNWFHNTKQSSENLILEIEMLLEFENKANIEIIGF